MQEVKHIRELFVDLYVNKEFVTDKTGVKTLELVGSSFIADETAIFGKPNQEYIDREIAWYNSQSLNVNDIPGETPAIWQMISSKDGMINSNYGYLVFSEENGNQYRKVLQQLLCDSNSRRAVMIYQRPSMHEDFNDNEMSDFICTNGVQYVIRENKVHAVVQMRSNDVVFGYRNDYAWQKYVLDKLIVDLNTLGDAQYRAGDITWQVGSLHVYERHFNFIEKYISESVEQIVSAERAMEYASSAMGDY
tara:strand:+ start:2463 stop:3209 length:747 start_codon:yes stop_codon:yes gene_type:complete